MADPIIHLIVGPNGSGKTTFFERVLSPITSLEFINADVIAAEIWGTEASEHAYDAAKIASQVREQRIHSGQSFIAETVFSHASKLDIIRNARTQRYVISLHVLLISEDLAVARVANRIENGGHSVPENKIRERYQRLWSNVQEAIETVDDATVYDNSSASRPFRIISQFRQGQLVVQPKWPVWTPAPLRSAGINQ